jgi:16S rRNA processing protein RimM
VAEPGGDAKHPQAWVPVGRIVRTRGNRGEVIAEIYSNQPGRAERLREVRLEKGSLSRVVPVEEVWMHDSKTVLKFEGLDSISDSEVWAGADILVPEAERVKPEEGEYSHADLIGCVVVDGRTGQQVGLVEEIESAGGPELLKVVGEKEVLIPFARAICREIDIERKEIRVELPEGLLDL